MIDFFEEMDIEVIDNDDLTKEQIAQLYEDDMWLNDKKTKVNENTFAKYFRDVNKLQYNNGLFYTREGKETEETISKYIWISIEKAGINSSVANTVKKLLGAVKLASTVDELVMQENLIPFSNGDLMITEEGWVFNMDSYQPTPYRFPIPLMGEIDDTPYFHKWLDDLFTEEDITILQEYLGYALIPSTKAQKALFLVGEGGVGKSVISVILEGILGSALVSTTNTKEFLEDKFKLPELENSLVLYDDDLDSTALTGTGFYKKLITNNISITADRKYGQPFKFKPNVKVISCCNEMLTSMYDNTDGFYRRLLPLVTKPKRKDFVPDRNFNDKIKNEINGIVQWALIGLKRLIENDWVLSESERSKGYISAKKNMGNHFPDFLESVFDFGEEGKVTSVDIQSIYQVWCRHNGIDAKKPRTLQTWLTDNAESYGIRYSTHIPAGEKEVRGYKGMIIKPEWDGSNKIYF